MGRLIGDKNSFNLYRNLFEGHFPENLENKIYVEPFGGSFGLYYKLPVKPIKTVYNDINRYDFEIPADEIYYVDYKEIFEDWDGINTFFYVDPPYVGKEDYYENHNFRGPAHRELHNILIKTKGQWMLSYHDHPMITSLYSDFNIYRYKGKSLHHKREIIITNY